MSCRFAKLNWDMKYLDSFFLLVTMNAFLLIRGVHVRSKIGPENFDLAKITRLPFRLGVLTTQV